MALSTRSTFYFGWKITASNRYIDFNDGVDDLQAALTLGTYTAAGLATEIVSKMNDLTTLAFSVSFDRSTRIFTISADSNFSLLFNTGAQAGQSVASLIGFDADDSSGTDTYTSNFESGYSYTTQFQLQSYKSTDKNRKAIDGIVNKSASGIVEVVKFGDERFLECEAIYITNVVQGVGSIIVSSSSGVEDYLLFIEYATEKGKIEFMPDYADVETFQSFILESTEASQLGLDYELIELYDKGLPEYYRSGKLKFRLLE